MLEVDSVTVRFGETLALDGASVAVNDGEVMALLGPSGSGKSTLLRAIAGLQPLDRGAVRFDGQDLSAVPAHERGFGLMFQSYALFPHLTVAENVGFGLKMAGRAAEAIAARTREVLAWVGLIGMEKRRVDRLSGGEQQRVALARTIAPDPRLIMFDEPVGALDRKLRERLVEELADRLQGRTVIYVTHDHDEARLVASRIAVMNLGRIVQVGTYQELREGPADPWVNEFVS